MIGTRARQLAVVLTFAFSMALVPITGRADVPLPVTAPSNAKVAVSVDTTHAPETSAWAKSAKTYTEQWYPAICRRLASDDFTPPDHVTLVFSKDYKGVAATAGTTVTVSVQWITAHPDDLGMIAHEITHVIQHYPSNKAGWLVEGIADYIRYYYVEPNSPRARFNIDKSNWNGGYQPSAAFLNYLERKYPDKNIVATLNAALRKGVYSDGMIKELTGKEPDVLWQELKDKTKAGK